MRSLTLSFALSLIAATAAMAKPDANAEAVRAASDPAKGPPIVEPLFKSDSYSATLGGPGGYYPERAERLYINGSAVIQCKMASSGVLTSCTVLAEGPTTYEFGTAALKMAEVRHMIGKPQPGLADGADVRVIVVFKQR